MQPHIQKLTCSVPKRAIKQVPASSCWLSIWSRGCLLLPTENHLLSADLHHYRTKNVKVVTVCLFHIQESATILTRSLK